MEAGLCRAGLDPPPTLVRTLFDAIDENASYKIGFAELQEWLKGGERRDPFDSPPSSPTTQALGSRGFEVVPRAV